MISLRALDEERTRWVYQNWMVEDFPPSELKSLSMIENAVRAGRYDVLGAYDGDALVGYALLYRPADRRVLLLDYLAVRQDMRGQGVGTAILAALRSYYPACADALMIECERPKAAADEATARKRIRFYTKAGAALTSVRILLFEVEYSILMLPCAQRVPEMDVAETMLALYRQMLPEDKYRRWVSLLQK